MAEESGTTRYIRNRRPNGLNIRVGGRQSYNARLNIQLGRRGSRSDTIALDAQDFNSREVQTHLRQGNIEEISEESFMTLGLRESETGEEGIASEEEQRERAANLKKRAPEATFEVSRERNAETVVPEFQPSNLNYHKEIPVTPEARARARRLMSPSLEYIEEPAPTDKELAPKKQRRSRKTAPKE